MLLIVDDNEVDRYILERYIEKCQSDAILKTFINGREVMEFIKKEIHQNKAHNIKLMFLDINMPILDGFGVLDELNDLVAKEPQLKELKVVMVTSSTIQEEIKKAKSYPFVKGYIFKPVDEQKLKEFI